MNCKGCEHFHIRQHPIKADGGGYWDLGLVECEKHKAYVTFATMRNINKLTCIESDCLRKRRNRM